MKIAVYAIALNEEQFVKRWAESAEGADYILLADTGSTDSTVELAQGLGVHTVNIGVSPWRFDDARNASLAALPQDIDYCIALDLDEILKPGWRSELEKATATRPRYLYTWSWLNGKPGLQYQGDKIHTRKNYRWRHPVHEVLTNYGAIETQEDIALEIEHHADDTKSRGQYLPLLKMAVDENPHDDRNAFYYGRELAMAGKPDEAGRELLRHLALPSAQWAPERSASMRLLASCWPQYEEDWLQAAIDECPGRREAIVQLAFLNYQKENWGKTLSLVEQATAIQEKPLDFLCEGFAWGALIWDIGAVAAYNLGDTTTAIEYAKVALELDTEHPRLAANLAFFEGAQVA